MLTVDPEKFDPKASLFMTTAKEQYSWQQINVSIEEPQVDFGSELNKHGIAKWIDYWPLNRNQWTWKTKFDQPSKQHKPVLKTINMIGTEWAGGLNRMI